MKTGNNLISIILPTYNEKGNICPLIGSILKNLPEVNLEIIVVDDNSPDGTARLVRKKYAHNRKVKIFIRYKNKGLAHSILEGIHHANGDYIITMDTDFNHDPRELTRFLALKDSYDLVIGSRYIRGGGMENKLRYALSHLYNLIIRRLLHLDTHDNLSGFFLIKGEKLKNFALNKIFYGYGDYFIRLVREAKRHELNITEIPVYYKNRPSGESKSEFMHMFMDYTKTVISILKEK